jgi:hypothetical protein
MRLSKTVDPAIQEHMRHSLTPSATLFTTAPDALARGCLSALSQISFPEDEEV